MKTETIVSELLYENTYIVYDEKEKTAIIIDAGCESRRILNFTKLLNLKIVGILATHGHFDHIKSVSELKDITQANFYAHKDDEDLIKFAPHYGKIFHVDIIKSPKIDKYVNDNDLLKFGNISVVVIHTPGHSPGGVCYLIDNVLFSGDTLFKLGIGRTDFVHGNSEHLINSIKNKLFSLPKETLVFPGHGEKTTIETEIKNNPYLGHNCSCHSDSCTN